MFKLFIHLPCVSTGIFRFIIYSKIHHMAMKYNNIKIFKTQAIFNPSIVFIIHRIGSVKIIQILETSLRHDIIYTEITHA